VQYIFDQLCCLKISHFSTSKLFPGDRNGENTEMVNCSKIISDNPELLRMVYFRVTVSIYPSYRNITPNVV
jgi:hypothetical protein